MSFARRREQPAIQPSAAPAAPTEPIEPSALSEPSALPVSGITVEPNGNLTISVSTSDEAKLAITQLRLQKREHQLQRDPDRRRHADELATCDEQQAELDTVIMRIDAAILQLEQFILAEK